MSPQDYKNCFENYTGLERRIQEYFHQIVNEKRTKFNLENGGNILNEWKIKTQ